MNASLCSRTAVRRLHKQVCSNGLAFARPEGRRFFVCGRSCSQTSPKRASLRSISLTGAKTGCTPRSPVTRIQSRRITTKTREWVLDSTKEAGRITVYLWAAAFLAFVAWQGYQHDSQERKTPTPHEWSLITRYWTREAKRALFPSQAAGAEPPHWIDVARNVEKALARLEDPNGDGKDARPALGEGEGDIFIEGIGRAGLDVSQCSEAWRRGYCDALMTAAAAAEHVDGFVVDKSQDGHVFPPQVVIGPNNPNPMPLPYNSKTVAPRQEKCERFFHEPQTFYMRILTSVGFSNDQKLAAALAYADWLDFKGLPSSASDMYEWAMDIADAGYRERGQTGPYDRVTGSLKADPAAVSSNILKTINAYAQHLARNGDAVKALPTFLTVLRVMRSLTPRQTLQQDNPASSESGLEPPSILSTLTSFISDTPFPPPPPSGDLPATRSTSAACEEAAILAHIGEILYSLKDSQIPSSLLSTASPTSLGKTAVQATKSQLAGLAWTRQAVDLAESSLCELAGRNRDELLVSGQVSDASSANRGVFGSGGMQTKKPKRQVRSGDGSGQDEAEREEALKTCAQCVEVAVGNWITMVGRLADRERAVMAERARQRRKTEPVNDAQHRSPGTKSHQNESSSDSSDNKSNNNSGWLSWLWRSSDGQGTGTSTGTSNDRTGRTRTRSGGHLGFWIDEARAVDHRRTAIRKLLREERLPVDF